MLLTAITAITAIIGLTLVLTTTVISNRSIILNQHSFKNSILYIYMVERKQPGCLKPILAFVND